MPVAAGSSDVNRDAPGDTGDPYIASDDGEEGEESESTTVGGERVAHAAGASTSGKEKLRTVQWTGSGNKQAVLLFSADVMKRRISELRNIGEKYHFTFKLLRECKLIRGILAGHGFQEAHPNSQDFTILWTGGHIKPYLLRSLSEYQKVNHFPRSSELTRKDRLYKNVQKMQQLKGMKNFDIVPNSYILPGEYQEFCSTSMREKGTWIVKPVASSRGRGIYLIDHPDKVSLDEVVIVSRYLHKPLLVDGFKFDIRLYVLVTSYDPLVIYLFEEGLARFATVRYDKSTRTIKNNCMHLTNYSVNKKSGDFVSNEDPEVEDYGNKWSLGALLRCLRVDGHDTTALMMRIEDVLIKSILAVEHQIATACRMFVPFKNNCFELYGFDVLIDTALRPWVLEVNLSPSLNCDSPLDLKIKSHVMSDIFSIVGFPLVDSMQKSASQSRRNVDLNQRPKSGTRPHSATRAGNSNANNKGPSLSGDEIRMVRRAREEYARRGGFVRIFPTAESWDLYSNFLTGTSTTNLVLHQRLFPDKHPIPANQRPGSAPTYNGKMRSIHMHNAPSQMFQAPQNPEIEKLIVNGLQRSVFYERKLGSKGTPSTTSLRLKGEKNGPIKATLPLKDAIGSADSSSRKEESSKFATSTQTKPTEPQSSNTLAQGVLNDPTATNPSTSSAVQSATSSMTEKPGQLTSCSVSSSAVSQQAALPNGTSTQSKLTSDATGLLQQQPIRTGGSSAATASRESGSMHGHGNGGFLEGSDIAAAPPSTVKDMLQTQPSGSFSSQLSLLKAQCLNGTVEREEEIQSGSSLPSRTRLDLVGLLRSGATLTKVQARKAFATYLMRVQYRLFCETAQKEPDSADVANEQMDLVLRFLRRAAINLTQPFKVVVPSRRLALNDRRRVLAKQLGDFVHLYSKETDLIQVRQHLKHDPTEKDGVDSSKFDEFVGVASESALEEVLTTYTQINKSASIFLGGAKPQSPRSRPLTSTAARTQQPGVVRSRSSSATRPVRATTTTFATSGDAMYGAAAAELAERAGSFSSERAVADPSRFTYQPDVSPSKNSLKSAALIYSTRLTQRPSSAGNQIRKVSSTAFSSEPSTHDVTDALQRLSQRQQSRNYRTSNINLEGSDDPETNDEATTSATATKKSRQVRDVSRGVSESSLSSDHPAARGSQGAWGTGDNHHPSSKKKNGYNSRGGDATFESFVNSEEKPKNSGGKKKATGDRGRAEDWEGDAAAAYNHVTGVKPRTEAFVPTRNSSQYEVLKQQHHHKHMLEQSRALLESSKAKHQAMIAQAHAATRRFAEAVQTGAHVVPKPPPDGNKRTTSRSTRRPVKLDTSGFRSDTAPEELL